LSSKSDFRAKEAELLAVHGQKRDVETAHKALEVLSGERAVTISTLKAKLQLAETNMDEVKGDKTKATFNL
jgi:hypothetical protein